MKSVAHYLAGAIFYATPPAMILTAKSEIFFAVWFGGALIASLLLEYAESANACPDRAEIADA